MTIPEEKKNQFLQDWKALGELLLDNSRIGEQELEHITKHTLGRIARGVPNARVGIAIPCAPGRSIVEETLACVTKLCFEWGLQPFTIQSFEIANNREKLLDLFIMSGFKRLLFLDSDTVVEAAGFNRMMETMDRLRCAMVAAPVVQRYTGAAGDFNAFIENPDVPGGFIPLRKEHFSSGGFPFPVTHVGLAAALLDLDKIKEKPGPRFKRSAEGHKHYGEDIAFCDWMRKHDLDFYVDPQVSTVHCVQHRFLYQYQPQE